MQSGVLYVLRLLAQPASPAAPLLRRPAALRALLHAAQGVRDAETRLAAADILHMLTPQASQEALAAGRGTSAGRAAAAAAVTASGAPGGALTIAAMS